MRSTSLLFIVTSLFFSARSVADQMYYYEDENGGIHFSDEPTTSSKQKTYEPSQDSVIKLENSTTSFLEKSKWKANHSKLKETIYTLANTYNVDCALIEAVILAESAYNTMAISRAGARGLMQLMPQTAKLYGVQNIHDPQENISGGIRYLSELIEKYNHNLDLALAAYNAGQTAVEKYKGVPPFAETIDYVAKVRKYYNHFANQQDYIVATEPDSI